jgi:hypothetical protein
MCRFWHTALPTVWACLLHQCLPAEHMLARPVLRPEETLCSFGSEPKEHSPALRPAPKRWAASAIPNAQMAGGSAICNSDFTFCRQALGVERAGAYQASAGQGRCVQQEGHTWPGGPWWARRCICLALAARRSRACCCWAARLLSCCGSWAWAAGLLLGCCLGMRGGTRAAVPLDDAEGLPAFWC